MDEEFTCDLLQITKMHKDNYYLALTHPHWLKIVKNGLINRIFAPNKVKAQFDFWRENSSQSNCRRRFFSMIFQHCVVVEDWDGERRNKAENKVQISLVQNVNHATVRWSRKSDKDNHRVRNSLGQIFSLENYRGFKSSKWSKKENVI